ncbi:hypothetical protein ABQI47_005788 [Klebsiella michiganensis]|uniref:Ead/Ea22-like family protein n=1 Tax=Klebsiella quasipneumoniae TaxID=1463165 RepID=A0ABD7N190_9ENTR|nr:hypothetical protein [Klebsiella pneumoniae]SSF66445.1 Uncharacterised protein [Klebsiella quasipneumoniae]HDK6082900.1 hypothetical protein [Klebsiella variicola]HDU4938078.1 hypothetical protein [Klebsiella pneumoniae subsp. pneumoniae]SSG49238.1 Uncharacterised protein [Klebsiella quasipneumoniae]
MSKIENPVVLIHKRDNDDSYAVAITSGSQNHHDAVLMASMEPDMVGDDVDTWSKTGYYMAAEIESLRERLKQAEEKHIHLQGLVDDYDWQRQRLHSAAKRIIRWNRQEAIDRTGDAENAESYACVRELRDALSFCEKSGFIPAAEPVQSGGEVAAVPVNDITTGKPFTITLPDISSKAFWSGNGKAEVFHPETYKRWVKEAIERYCAIARIDVEVK